MTVTFWHHPQFRLRQLKQAHGVLCSRVSFVSVWVCIDDTTGTGHMVGRCIMGPQKTTTKSGNDSIKHFHMWSLWIPVCSWCTFYSIFTKVQLLIHFQLCIRLNFIMYKMTCTMHMDLYTSVVIIYCKIIEVLVLKWHKFYIFGPPSYFNASLALITVSINKLCQCPRLLENLNTEC